MKSPPINFIVTSDYLDIVSGAPDLQARLPHAPNHQSLNTSRHRALCTSLVDHDRLTCPIAGDAKGQVAELGSSMSPGRSMQTKSRS